MQVSLLTAHLVRGRMDKESMSSSEQPPERAEEAVQEAAQEAVSEAAPSILPNPIIDHVEPSHVIELPETDVPAASKAVRKLSKVGGRLVKDLGRRLSSKGEVDLEAACAQAAANAEASERRGSNDSTGSAMERQSSLGSNASSGREADEPASSTTQPLINKPEKKSSSKRRGSMQIMSDLLGLGTTRMTSRTGRRKASLSVWSNFTTVSFNSDAKRDFERYGQQVRDESKIDKMLHEVPTWIMPGIVGALTACSGYLIEKMVDWLGDMRLGICEGGTFSWWFTTKLSCGKNDTHWETWEWPYIHYIWFSTLIATVAATMTWAFAPMARGSGIPEIKTVLGGFVMREVLDFNTLVVKIFGLALSVAAGLSCGKEGPLVHIACCWSNFVCKLTPRFATNEGKQRECLSCACAAGVAIAFGAPLGGVLFSLEEASSYFPTRTMVRAFFAGSVAATVMQMWKTDSHGTKPLTMFEADYRAPPHIVEYFFFVILGIVGGCIGALFVHYNVMVTKARSPGSKFRKRCHVVLEVCMIALITAITSYPVIFTRVISNATIRALFLNCYEMKIPEGQAPMDYHLGVCQEDGKGGHEPNISFGTFSEPGVVPLLLIAGVLRYVQMIFTFGTGTPSGLFIPSLYAGAVLGRVTGILVIHLNYWIGFRETAAEVFPGIYAMLGAAAVLGGVCRVTISLVVIMFELTGGIQLIVPFMIVCLLAKWVGDSFTPGIYDYYITVRKYPYLHEPDHTQFDIMAEDIMDDSIDLLHPQEQTVKSFNSFLKKYSKHSGYPITCSKDDASLLGYMSGDKVREHIEELMEGDNNITASTKVGFWELIQEEAPSGAVDLTRFVDRGVHRVAAETPSADIHNMFRLLGIKLVLVVRKGDLVGLITKKAYINFMATGRNEIKAMRMKAAASDRFKKGVKLIHLFK